jgi:alkanesulfonate monooxygenase SsuD/methylene tetrahydromethanopterin reductase-like flavin-dependent oxidoreductase (luciferase family)
VRVGLVILPTDRWAVARRQWEWADEVGFATAWTYDHIRWGGMPDGPWHAAVPVLAAAAGVTARIRLGTLVATPNFRHPVTFARDVLALDDLSEGRFDLGIGPGSLGPDATALAREPWTAKERFDRFAEFLQILRAILDGEASTRTTMSLHYYGARDAPSTPGAVQSPIPLTVAAGGPRGLALAVRFGQRWVTTGPTGPGASRDPDDILRTVRDQCNHLESACTAAGRDPATLGKVLLWTPEAVLHSAEAFDELAAPYAALGFEEFVLHHPDQTGPYGGSLDVFAEIAQRGAAA